MTRRPATVALAALGLWACAHTPPFEVRPGQKEQFESWTYPNYELCMKGSTEGRPRPPHRGTACYNHAGHYYTASPGWYHYMELACGFDEPNACRELVIAALNERNRRYVVPADAMAQARALELGMAACSRGPMLTHVPHPSTNGDTCAYSATLLTVYQPQRAAEARAALERGCYHYTSDESCRRLERSGVEVNWDDVEQAKREVEAAQERRAERERRELAEERRLEEQERAANAAYREEVRQSLQQSMRQGQEDFQRNLAQQRQIIEDGQRREREQHEAERSAAELRLREQERRDEERRQQELARRQEEERERVEQARTAQARSCPPGQRMGPRDYCVPEACPRGTFRHPDTGACDSCSEMTTCARVTTQPAPTGYCDKGATGIMSTVKNACDTSPIACRVWPEGGSRNDSKDYAEYRFKPGESLGGWATELIWCDRGTRVLYQCMSDSHQQGAECLSQ